ncbi:MAG: hypothetical protein GYA21_02295 [Myxococcales bacterium]|nr:hypothetical protein [Myxococcales bacterium]
MRAHAIVVAAWLCGAVWSAAGSLRPASAGEVEFNGSVASENFLGVSGDDAGRWFDFRNANTIGFKLKAHPSDEVTASASLEVRNTNFSEIRLVTELWDRAAADPVSLRVREAYVQVDGFVFDGDEFSLDLRAGKQIVAWGEADSFNPTNNFDPYDLENPLDFKERLANVSLKLDFNIGDDFLLLEGVFVPRHLPSLLPIDLLIRGDPLQSPLMPAIDPRLLAQLETLGILLVPPGLDVVTAPAPAFAAENIAAGARLKGSFFGFDMSVSYFRGRDLLPAPTLAKTRLAGSVAEGCPQGGTSCLVFDGVELSYPRLQVVGFDFRGSLGKVGVWGEVGVVFPEKVATVVEAGLLGSYQLAFIDDTPFTKWTLGAEYTFPGGLFVNAQWVHGFFAERTGHALHDYLFVDVKKTFLSERLRLELMLGGEVDPNRGRRALGGFVGLEAGYKPYDGAEVVLGCALAAGEERTTFDLFEDLSQVYLKIRADF